MAALQSTGYSKLRPSPQSLCHTSQRRLDWTVHDVISAALLPARTDRSPCSLSQSLPVTGLARYQHSTVDVVVESFVWLPSVNHIGYHVY